MNHLLENEVLALHSSLNLHTSKDGYTYKYENKHHSHLLDNGQHNYQICVYTNILLLIGAIRYTKNSPISASASSINLSGWLDQPHF